MKSSSPAKTNKQSKPPLDIPNFKSEAEEAAWWDANADYLFERAKKFGKLVGPLKVRPTTRPVSLRINEGDIRRAKEIAVRKGVGYQTVLKQAIHRGLEHEQ